MTFGEKLYKLRSAAGFSQDRLAEELDVSRQAVSKWERNEAMPDIDKVLKISALFSVSTDYLLKDEILESEPAPQPKPTNVFLNKVLEFINKYWHWSGAILIILGIKRLPSALVSTIIMVGIIRTAATADISEAGQLSPIFGTSVLTSVIALLIAIAMIVGGILIIRYGIKNKKAADASIIIEADEVPAENEK